MTARFHTIILASLLCIISITITRDASAQSDLCRKSCGGLPIRYPFGVDDGCGTTYYRSLLVCSHDNKELTLRTPTGTYPVRNITYGNDPHLVILDPSMWNCTIAAASPSRSTTFRLDASTKFSISVLNNFLFLNCNASQVIVRVQPTYCHTQPGRCGSFCDSGSPLCHSLPRCLTSPPSCCSYFPRTSDSMRLMLEHCDAYTSYHWNQMNVSGSPVQVPSHGIRLNFEVPVMQNCTRCQDKGNGGGTCGFHTESGEFLCLCKDGNSTTYCDDSSHFHYRHKNHAGVIAGTLIAFVTVGAIIGAAIFWYLRKRRANQPFKLGVVNSNSGM